MDLLQYILYVVVACLVFSVVFCAAMVVAGEMRHRHHQKDREFMRDLHRTDQENAAWERLVKNEPTLHFNLNDIYARHREYHAAQEYIKGDKPHAV